jgi:small subunit ribosomal protein S9
MTDINIKETIIKTENPKNSVVRTRQIDKLGRAYATGKRKNSIARVWIKETQDNKGKVVINGVEVLKYLKRTILVVIINQPFEVTETLGKYDVICTVSGGGLSGQAGAIRHGIAKALQNFNPLYRDILKKSGLLTRDPRVVERKKPGRKKARRGPTYRKR